MSDGIACGVCRKNPCRCGDDSLAPKCKNCGIRFGHDPLCATGGDAARVKNQENELKGSWMTVKMRDETISSLTAERDALKIEYDRQYYRAQDFEERAEAAEEALRTLRDTVDDLVDAAIEKEGEVRRCTVCDTEWRADVHAGWPRHSDGCAIETLEKALAATAPADGAGEGG